MKNLTLDSSVEY